MRAPLRAWLFGLAFLPLACGDETESPEYELPQIVPNTNVFCLNYEDPPIEAMDDRTFSVQLSNRGRQSLELGEAAVENDLRGSFELVAMKTEAGTDCTADKPCFIETYQSAYLAFRYRPTAAGWDAADLRISSNAENYPRLKVFVLGLAYPDGAPSDYDPGPKPDVARGADGAETCP